MVWYEHDKTAKFETSPVWFTPSGGGKAVLVPLIDIYVP